MDSLFPFVGATASERDACEGVSTAASVTLGQNHCCLLQPWILGHLAESSVQRLSLWAVILATYLTRISDS